MYSLLIVEDEELLRKSLCVMINWEAIGIQIAGEAENGVDALHFLAAHPVDIVMTDIRMPAMDGLELACEIQSKFPRVKTVLCSAYSEFAFAQKGIEYGVYGYLLKSLDEEEIATYFQDMCQKLDKEALYHPTEDVRGNRPDLWRRRMRLAQALSSGSAAESVLLEEAAACRVTLDSWPTGALQIHLDDSKLLSEELGGTGMRQLDKILGEKLLTELEWQGLGSLLRVEEGALVLWTDFGEGYQSRLEQLHHTLTEELNAFETTTRITLTLAVGLPVWSVPELPQSFHSALDALTHKFYLGGNRVIEAPSVIQGGDRVAGFEDSAKRLQQAQRCCHEQDITALLGLLEETAQEWSRRRVTDQHSVELFAMKLILLLTDQAGGLGGRENQRNAREGEILHAIEKLETIEAIFERLSLSCRDLLTREAEPPGEKQPKKLVEKALEFMRENYAGNISLERTAAFVNVHPVHLSRLFRQETAQTFKGILTQLRIDAAKNLLHDLDLRVYEISERVGYQKPRYFSELFKEVTGMTPLEYREKG